MMSDARVQDLWNLPEGDYKLVIDGSGNATGAFGFLLTAVGELGESLTDSAASVTIAPGTSLLRRFDLSSENRYFFDFVSADNQSRTRWRLIDPFGRVVFSDSIRDRRAFSVEVPGLYTLASENDAAATSEATELEFKVQTLSLRWLPAA